MKTALILTSWAIDDGANVPQVGLDYLLKNVVDYTGNYPNADPNTLIVAIHCEDAVAETILANEDVLTTDALGNLAFLDIPEDSQWQTEINSWLNA